MPRAKCQFEGIEVQRESSEDEKLRAATMRSLKRYINQFKEEIARYQAHQTTGRITRL